MFVIVIKLIIRTMSFQNKLYCFCLLVYFCSFCHCWDILQDGKGVCHRRFQPRNKFCCEGYMKNYEVLKRLQCVPNCDPACINSTCTTALSMNFCLCKLGYIKDLKNYHICVPLCHDCFNGDCVAPDVCNCKHGYEKFDGDCKPVCTEPCLNGDCVAPDVCNCTHGYEKVDGDCKPVCTEPCLNGDCVSPGNCVCHLGYRPSDVNICEPHCSTGCNEGRYCIAPDTCACQVGWQQDEPKLCKPICSPSCFNGYCVAPNTCQCNTGFVKTQLFGYSTCLPYSTTSTAAATTAYTSESVSENLLASSFNDGGVSYDDLSTYVEMEATTATPVTKDTHMWIYIVLAAILILMAALVLVAVYRRQLLSCIKRGNYDVAGRQHSKSAQDSSYNVTFSSVNTNKEF